MFWPYLLAFLLAGYISLNDFFATNPSIYFAFAKTSTWLWAYAVIFGLFSLFFLWLLSFGILEASVNTSLKVEGFGQYKIWAYAVLAGLSTRSLLNISLYNIVTDGKVFPIGLATIVQLFEPHVKKQLEDDHFICFDKFLNRAVQCNSQLTLQKTHDTIRETLSTKYTGSEVTSFLLQLASTTSQKEAFNLYLVTFGKKIFCHTFKCQ